MTHLPSVACREPSPLHRVEGESGVTLIESLIAMVVLTIGLLGLFVLHQTALHSSAHAFRVNVATWLAEDGMEYLLTREYNVQTQDALLAASGTDPTTTTDPYVTLGRYLPGEALGTLVNGMGGSDATYGSAIFQRSYHVEAMETDGSRIMLKVRVSFDDPYTGKTHGVTVGQSRSYDTVQMEAPGT